MAVSSLREVSYQPDRVAFNQDQCAVCLEPFANSQRVTELACKHIFHTSCIPESVAQCPTCRDPIEGRIQHQVQVHNGYSFLQRMFSVDPIALNQRLERRARGSIFNPRFGREALQDDLLNIARGIVLGDEISSEVRQRADALFLQAEMRRMNGMNRVQRALHIQSTGQARRLLEISENPELGSEFSRKVAREYRTDERRAIVAALSALISACFWIWSCRPSHAAFG